MTTNKLFYSKLAEVRELFHKYGRFDDSNAKLDEIAKYLAIYVLEIQNKSKTDIKAILKQYEINKAFPLVVKLKEIFEITSHNPLFLLQDGHSVFGNHPKLNIDDNDNDFAYLLLQLVMSSVDAVFEGGKNFDLLNECFGHFVRDSFRNHIEDAQYMTPNEVVELMCDIALNDIETDENNSDFIVMDPCCGVGSFISTFYTRNLEKQAIDENRIKLVGQDKVERMVRLSKINLVFGNNQSHNVANGNSLVGQSSINEYQGKVDLILTNPPFGAKFSSGELKENAKLNYPFLFDVILKNGTNFSSEVLFVDRCLSLLRPGGKMLAVLPDSVISSAGLNATLRHRLAYSRQITIKAIIELPAVTFAQAGTRTKTSILYLEKSEDHTPVFIAQCKGIGFEVSTKKGATVKYEFGKNDLPDIFKSYRKTNFTIKEQSQKVLSFEPSCVLVNPEILKTNSWTPNHYQAQRFTAVNSFIANNSDTELIKLSEIADFDTNARKREIISDESKCISILHVNGEELNLEELMIYNPKYQGFVCKSGDLLFSKINPRILRVLIVPELDFSLTCSTEFEIINSKIEISNYGLKLLLMLPSVQKQINSLTSGTSSSHNRIKSKDLGEVLIPLPKKGTDMYELLLDKSKSYEQKNKSFNQIKFEMFRLKSDVFNLVS
jgi:type I restriction-modification system DNA methylase subunit